MVRASRVDQNSTTNKASVMPELDMCVERLIQACSCGMRARAAFREEFLGVRFLVTTRTKVERKRTSLLRGDESESIAGDRL